MKIKETYLLSEIEEENIVITVGDVENSFNGYLKLNETSTFLWKQLENEISLEELIDCFKEAYNIEYEVAKNDVQDFIKSLHEVQALEE